MAEHLHGYPRCETPAGKPCPPTDLNYNECQSHGPLVSCAQSVVDGIPTSQYHCLHAEAQAPRAKAKAKVKPKAKAKKKAAPKAKRKPKKAAKKAAKKAKKAAKKGKGKKKAGKKKKK